MGITKYAISTVVAIGGLASSMYAVGTASANMRDTVAGGVSFTSPVKIDARLKPDGTLIGDVAYARLSVEEAGKPVSVTLQADDLELNNTASGATTTTNTTTTLEPVSLQALDRSHLTITPATVALTPGIPQDVAVKVTAITTPGQYRSKIHLVVPGPDGVIDVDIRVRHAAEPKPSPDKITGNLTNAKVCGLARPVFGEAVACRSDFSVDLVKQPGVEVNAEAVAVLRGEHSHQRLSSTEPDAALTVTQKPGRTTDVVTVDFKHREDIPADHYTGTLYLTLSGEQQTRAVPLDFNVRHGVFWPFMLLLVTVFLGWAANWFKTKGFKKRTIRRALRRFRKDVERAPAADRAGALLVEAKVKELEAADKLDEAVTLAQTLPRRLLVLAEIRELEKQVPDNQGVKEKAAAAYASVTSGEDFEAARKALIQEVHTNRAAAARTTTMASDAAGAAGRAMSWVRSFATGSLLDIAGPVIGVTAFVLILLIGIKETYLEDPNFGAEPLRDYLTLALWGTVAWATKRAATGV